VQSGQFPSTIKTPRRKRQTEGYQMGSTTFVTTGSGTSAKAAFKQARDEERSDREMNGDKLSYTGSILEKSSFVMVRVEPGEEVQLIIEDWLDQNDDKWGPAGCIDNEDGNYTFFGWASE
jgi:hypothetical protein